jgi:hypothetical protein
MVPQQRRALRIESIPSINLLNSSKDNSLSETVTTIKTVCENQSSINESHFFAVLDGRYRT